MKKRIYSNKDADRDAAFIWAGLMLWMIFVCVYIVSTLIVGCASTPGVVDVKKANFQDLEVEINGKTFFGMGVVPRAEKYEIKVKPPGNVTRLIISTCHKTRVFDKPKKEFWSKAIVYEHVTAPGLEDKQSCLFKITTLDDKQNDYRFFTADLLDTRPSVSAPAFVKCNGNQTNYPEGASVCQAPVGKFQSITLEEKAIVRTTSDCENTISTKDDRTFEFVPNPGLCIYYFGLKRKCPDGLYCKHRLSVYGVTDYPFKEE